MIDALFIAQVLRDFNILYPDASATNAHIVLGDFNLADEHIDFCLELELPNPVRDFLEWLMEQPEEECDQRVAEEHQIGYDEGWDGREWSSYKD